MSTFTKEKERRQSKRFGIQLGAIVAFEETALFSMGESITLQCNILDFCTQGLFLEIRKSYTDLTLLLHKKIKVLLSLNSGQGRDYTQIEAKVIRVCSNGIGVATEKISESLFRALLKKATSQVKPETSSGQVRAVSAVNKERFKLSLKELLRETLPLLMDGFFNSVCNDLELAAERAIDLSEKTVFLEATRRLRFHQVSIAKDYCRSVVNEMDFVRKLPPENTMAATDAYPLTLIEKEEFEDSLTLSSSIKRVASNFSDQLNQIELKLSYVSGIPRQDINNPVSPDKLFSSFKENVSQLDEIRTVKQMLYKVFERALMDNLDNLYKSLEKLLEDYGAPSRIVEEIAYHPQETAKLQRDMLPGDKSMSGQQPIGQNTAVQHERQVSELSAYPVVPIQQQTNRVRQGQPLAQTASKLLDIIYQRDTIARQIAQGDLPAYDELIIPAYSSDEIVGAIEKLHAKAVASASLHQDASSLQKHLSEILAADTGGAKKLSSSDQSRLEVYGQLYETLMNDLMFIPHIKSYLEAIQLPLMALSLKDSDFLDSETHPARSVLNQLFALEGAVKGNKIIKSNKIRQTLDQLFGRIAQESINNPEIFAIVDEELKEISQPVAKSRDLAIRRVIEAYEGKQKLEQARDIIQEEIDKRIAGKLIPEVVSTLLESGWQHLLVITELNDEHHANKRQRYLKVIDELLYWLAVREPFSDEQLLQIRQELDLIGNQLGSVCTNAFLHGKVMDELKATLLGTGNPPIRIPVEKKFIAPRKSGAINSINIIENNWTRQVDRLQIGEWFTLSLEAEEFEPLKLVWVGNKPQIYVFVNREGQKKLELSRDELAALMRTGSVNKIESLDEPLLDRAANMMLQKMHQKLVYNASHDPVTHLANRREFLRLLKERLTSIDDSRHMLCYIEILDFRMITNSCGIIAGDELLRNITQLLKSQVSQSEIIARLGDKTFGLLLKDCSEDEGYGIAKKLRDHINQSHFEWEDKSYSVGVSIGLVPFSQHGFNADELLQQADSASITAKRSGHNRIRLYKDDDASIKAQTGMHEQVGRIDQIFAENRLFVRCQKIEAINPDKSAHSHYETLLGIKDESGNIIAPGDFLPAVEHCRRMPEIDRWMIDAVFYWMQQHKSFFAGIGGFAINLSGQSLNSEEFLENLLRRLTDCDLPLHKITFEVTETVASDNLIFTETFISQIKHFGCKFSLDDFGTGYSSYSYLKSLDVDYLKIDGSFIKEIAHSPTDVAMVKSMNEIAHSLGLETIAEYVENDEIYAILKEIGVDYGQGWGIHKPVNIAELTI